MKSKTNSTPKKLKAILLIMVTFFFLFESLGQAITNTDLEKINGDWQGALTYTDYGDDKTQYELKTSMTAEWKNGKGKMKFYYTEPNGKIVTSSEKMKLLSESEFQFDGKWLIKSFEQKENSWELILEAQGKDNNRLATIRQLITVSSSNFTIRKMVQYEGTNTFFQRSKQAFSK